ncbi:MAG: hypothetical protein KKH68_04425 [Proteobacteria bacterium]|nr:hypothetical protein [Pseudomonadota bacterium]
MNPANFNFGEEKYSSVFVGVFLIVCTYFLLTLPVFKTDTDLWYHLSGGRYFFSNLRIPGESYYSFISPQKLWHNYYWLFQVIVYAVFSAASYYGIICFRAVLFIFTLFLIFRVLQKGAGASPAGALIVSLLVPAYALAILFRFTVVRPHMFSYLLIALFIYILEQRHSLSWMLPFLAIVWANVHGIEYPVMVIVLTAYALDIFWDGRRVHERYRDFRKQDRYFLIAAFYCVLLTPHGLAILNAPWDTAMMQDRYILELMPTSLSRLGRWVLYPFAALQETARNMLIAMTALCALWLAVRRRITAGRLLLLAASVYLLHKAVRFRYEYLLLTLPLVRDWIYHAFGRNKRWFAAGKTIWMYSAGLVIAVLLLWSQFGTSHTYPFSREGLPYGVIRFIKHVNVGGTVLNPPSTGGYWNWAVYPRFRIFMDLQMSVFSAEDFFLNRTVMTEPTEFERFVARYHPDFISVPRVAKSPVAERKDFVPVFLDNAEVLYVNNRTHPDVAVRYGLTHVDPHKVDDLDYANMDAEPLELLRQEMERLRSLDPENLPINLILGNVSLTRKDYLRALECADTLIHHFPTNYGGYMIKGTALYNSGKPEEALPLLQKAAKVQGDRGLRRVGNNLYMCLVQLKKYRDAYKVMSKTVEPFYKHTSHNDLYELAVAAARIGKFKDAELFLKFAEIKDPGDDPDFKSQLEKTKKILQEGK